MSTNESCRARVFCPLSVVRTIKILTYINFQLLSGLIFLEEAVESHVKVTKVGFSKDQ